MATIPATLHFCWIGPVLPWFGAFAVLSAAERGGLDGVVLHHTDALADTPSVRALRADGRVELRPLDPLRLLGETDRALGLGGALAALHARLPDPVGRSDLLRAAILFVVGGIYADLDTVTVRSLRPLLSGPEAFVGLERIVWTPAARRRRAPDALARALALDLLRKLLRALPGGWRAFRRLEPLYASHVNNAVMGARPGAAVIAAYLRAMAAVPPERQRARFALGPHLLAPVAARAAPGAIAQHDPGVFSPLAPEISAHWFRPHRRSPDPLRPETRIVHWYASVRARVPPVAIDPAHVRRHRAREPYSALVAACLPALGSLAA